MYVDSAQKDWTCYSSEVGSQSRVSSGSRDCTAFPLFFSLAHLCVLTENILSQWAFSNMLCCAQRVARVLF